VTEESLSKESVKGFRAVAFYICWLPTQAAFDSLFSASEVLLILCVAPDKGLIVLAVKMLPLVTESLSPEKFSFEF